MALAPLKYIVMTAKFNLFFSPFPSPELCGNYFSYHMFFPPLILISGWLQINKLLNNVLKHIYVELLGKLMRKKNIVSGKNIIVVASLKCLLYQKSLGNKLGILASNLLLK